MIPQVTTDGGRPIAEAVEQRLRLQMLGEIVDDYVAKHGPVSGEVAREVDAEWRAALGR